MNDKQLEKYGFSEISFDDQGNDLSVQVIERGRPFTFRTGALQAPLRVTITWRVDEYGFDLLDCMGTYTEKYSDYVIDRRKGLFFGEALSEPEFEDFLPPEYRSIPEDDIPEDAWVEAEMAYEEAYDAWEYADAEVLAEVGQDRDDRTYRFYKPGDNHCPPGHGWKHVSDDVVKKAYEDRGRGMRRYAIAAAETRGEMIRALDILYVCQDYNRMEGYGTEWVMTWCKVENEVDYETLGGIESDCGNYRGEVEEELLRKLLKE